MIWQAYSVPQQHLSLIKPTAEAFSVKSPKDHFGLVRHNGGFTDVDLNASLIVSEKGCGPVDETLITMFIRVGTFFER